MDKEAHEEFIKATTELFDKNGDLMKIITTNVQSSIMLYMMSGQNNYNSIYENITQKIKTNDKFKLWINCINVILKHYIKCTELANKYDYYLRYTNTQTLTEFYTVYDNMQNEYVERTKSIRPDLEHFNDTKKLYEKYKQIIDKHLKQIIVEHFFNFFNIQKSDSVKIMTRKIKIYIFEILEKSFDTIKEMNELSFANEFSDPEIKNEFNKTLKLIKAFDRYDYLKLYDIMAHFFVLYDKKYPFFETEVQFNDKAEAKFSDKAESKQQVPAENLNEQANNNQLNIQLNLIRDTFVQQMSQSTKQSTTNNQNLNNIDDDNISIDSNLDSETESDLETDTK